MSTASRPYPIVQDLIDSFASWLKHRREMNEMRQLDRADFDRIANDLRIAPDDLEELVRHGTHAADELPKMLDQLGISAEELGQAQPLLLRDMERVCSLCSHKARCDRELADGREFLAGAHYTMADIVLLCGIDFAKFIHQDMPEDAPHLRAWHARVSARPSARAI